MPIHMPVFKDQGVAVFAPTHWSKNACNRYHLDIVYKELPYTLWCAALPIYDVTGSECTVTIGRRGMEGGKCKNYVSYFKSESMPITKPIFKPQASSNREFDPKTWHKDKCNTFRVDILHSGPVPVDDWQYETAYVPMGFYSSFKEFTGYFNAAIFAATMKIFDRVHAHPDTTNIPKYTNKEYKAYELSFFQKQRTLARFHKVLDEMDNDMADALKMITGGHLWDTNSFIFHELSQYSNVGMAVGFTSKLRAVLNERFNEIAEKYAWGGEMGEYIKLVDTHNLWVTLTSYVKEEYPTVAALSIVKAFANDTNFSMKINHHMQH